MKKREVVIESFPIRWRYCYTDKYKDIPKGRILLPGVLV